MHKRWLPVFAVGLMLLVSAWSAPRTEAQQDAVVRTVFFWSETCPHCHEVMEHVLPPLQDEYGDRLEVKTIEISDPANYELWIAAMEAFQVPPERQVVPMLFIGDVVLVGSFEIPEQLPGLIEQHLAAGGVGYPAILGLPADPTPTPVPTHAADSSPRPTPTVKACHICDEEEIPPSTPTPIHLAYFYQPGCQECDRVQLALDYLQGQYPQLTVCALDVREQATLCEWLGERAGVPVSKRLTAPAVFVGDEALVGEELHTRGLEALLVRYAETGAGPICEGWEVASDETASGIVERFRSFGLLTILGAGLVDGLNPCAFATLVFFVSYLTFAGRRGREVLAAGGAFTLGVFLTYLGVGIGLLKFLAALPFLSAISRWVYGLTAVLCLFLAAGSLYDWWQARRGRLDEMRMKLPTRLRRWINRTVREGAGMRAFVPVTLVTGVVISVIELACTGQVYLPTILFVLGVPELRLQAGLYLLFYNLMFILPLVVLFVLAYFGTTSQQLGLFIHRHTATVKLATAGLFVLLAVWMVMTLL